MTLYGLKRSPQHFYELISKVLLAMGFQKTPNFTLSIQWTSHSQSPTNISRIDIYYFSESRQVEEHFECTISKEIDIELNGQVGYFLELILNATDTTTIQCPYL